MNDELHTSSLLLKGLLADFTHLLFSHSFLSDITIIYRYRTQRTRKKSKTKKNGCFLTLVVSHENNGIFIFWLID